MLIRSGIILIKYWFSVTIRSRNVASKIDAGPHEALKLSPMDLQSRTKWVEYSKAKDVMFAYTDIKQAPGMS
jgi:polyphosphate kinase 2 (PPK2 family)